MREADPIGNDARNAEHLRKLGRAPHICLFCGLDDPACLIAKPKSWLEKRIPRSVLEKHHVFLEALDPDFTVLLCILCHFRVTQGYVRAGIEFTYEPDPKLRVKLKLKALSVFLAMLSQAVEQWSQLL